MTGRHMSADTPTAASSFLTPQPPEQPIDPMLTQILTAAQAAAAR